MAFTNAGSVNAASKSVLVSVVVGLVVECMLVGAGAAFGAGPLLLLEGDRDRVTGPEPAEAMVESEWWAGPQS